MCHSAERKTPGIPAFLAGALLALPLASGQSAVSSKDSVPGPFRGNAASLSSYQIPAWFNAAKFGISCSFGPQSVAERGDAYLRAIYTEGSEYYKLHVKRFGHPSKFGFKDFIPLWQAENWDPDALMKLFKDCGARYVVVTAADRDNFDLWNSRHHRWNALAMGPKKDIVGLWSQAAHQAGLKFGLMTDFSHSPKWMAITRGADEYGPLAGTAYDGAEASVADLYGSSREFSGTNGPSRDLFLEAGLTEEWKRQWFLRCDDLLAQHKPDLYWTNASPLPFRQNAGWTLLANYLNRNIDEHAGRCEAVCCVRGNQDPGLVPTNEYLPVQEIQETPWQVYEDLAQRYYHRYQNPRSAGTVVRMLADVVSKNGNLVLGVPLMPDGTLDTQTQQRLGEITQWLHQNAAAIFETKPFKIFGEEPAPLADCKAFELAFTPQQIRYTTHGEYLYAMVLGVPTQNELILKELNRNSPLVQGEVNEIEMLGQPGKLRFEYRPEGLLVRMPPKFPNNLAPVLRLSGLRDMAWDNRVYPNHEGNYRLEPDDAILHGAGLKVIPMANKESYIAHWDSPSEYVSWKLKVRHAGHYQVMLRAASYPKCKMRVGVTGGESVSAALPGGGMAGPGVIDMGKILIPTTGDVLINLVPDLEWRPVHFYSLTLEKR